MLDNKMIAALPALRRLRLDRQMTQAQVAKKARVNVNTVSRIEMGVQRASVPTIKRLARVLGVTAEQLMGDNGQPTQAA